MMVDAVQQALNGRFSYRPDMREDWQILRGEGAVSGDCEDYALTLIWLWEGRSMLRFWWALIICRYVLWQCRGPGGGGHVVLWLRGQNQGWTDNIQRRVVADLPKGYHLRFPIRAPLVALKFLLRPVLRRL